MRYVSTLFLAALVGTGCGEAASAGTPKSGRPAAKVVLESASLPPLRAEVSLYGEVRTSQRAVVGAEVSGRVLRVLVREGGRVRRGATLTRLDDRTEQEQRRQLEAQLRALAADAKLASQRRARLQEAGSQLASATELDQAEATFERTQAEREAVEAQLAAVKLAISQHRVQAPFSGEVARLLVEAGAWVNPGDGVVELVGAGQPEVWAYATPDFARSLKRDTEAVSKVRAQYNDAQHGETQVPLTLIETVSSVSQGGSTQILRFRWEAEDLEPSTGETVRVKVARSYPGPGVVISRDALLRAPTGQWFVFGVSDGKAKRIEVEVVARSTTHALVRGEDLAAGAELVVRGNERLTPGQEVAAQPELGGA